MFLYAGSSSDTWLTKNGIEKRGKRYAGTFWQNHPNGKRALLETYRDGKLHGKSIAWYPTGKKMEEML